MADRRLLMSRIPNVDLVKKIFDVLAPRYSSRQGGYTRIYKMSRRAGDNAERAIIEFIDAQIKSAQTAEPKAKKAKKAVSAESAAKKAQMKEAKKAAKATKSAAKATKAEGGKETKAKAKKAKSK